MAGISRKDRRSYGEHCVDVYAADISRGWRVVKQVTALCAFNKVNAGKWVEIFDDCGNFYGVQVLAAIKSDQELPSGASATTITARDSMLFAGLGGPSRTIGMSEDRRITRFSPITCNALPPEDRIERVMAKVKQWPNTANAGGDRAIRVYPKTSPHHNDPRWFK